MKYLVMERNLSYAVVLDEEGRFKKVANLHYEVGQTVTDIVEMQEAPSNSTSKRRTLIRNMSGLATMVACLLLFVTTLFSINQAPYASVYMRINPQVRIDVNRNNIVVGLEGINDDGKKLIAGYSYKKKNLDVVTDELVDLAINYGYLFSGGKITLTLDADDNEWIVTTSQGLNQHLNEHLTDKISVTIEIGQENNHQSSVVTPADPTLKDSYDDSDYAAPDNTKSPDSETENNKEASDYNSSTQKTEEHTQSNRNNSSTESKNSETNTSAPKNNNNTKNDKKNDKATGKNSESNTNTSENTTETTAATKDTESDTSAPSNDNDSEYNTDNPGDNGDSSYDSSGDSSYDNSGDSEYDD